MHILKALLILAITMEISSILALVGNHDAIIARKIRNRHKNEKYTHNSVQITPLEIMAAEVKSSIFKEIQEGEFFPFLAYETKDVSKKEQLLIAVRYLYDKQSR